MEYWNDGMMEESKDKGPKPENKSDFDLCGLPIIPLFQYSSIPKGVFV